MSQKLQFKIRLDEALHAKIKEAADSNGKSVNAEIIGRLEQSFIDSGMSLEVLSETERLLNNYNQLIKDIRSDEDLFKRVAEKQIESSKRRT